MSPRKELTAAWCAVASCAALFIGWYWDIAWHRSVGRDTIWTPPHVAIYAGLAIASAYTGWLVWCQTFGKDKAAPGIRVLGLTARAGTLVTLWSLFAQLGGFIFDQWWHEVYGIDSSVMSPPHSIIALGVDAFFVGQMLLIASLANTSEGPRRRTMHVLLMVIMAMTMGNVFTGLDPVHGPQGMRAIAYMVSGAVSWPLILVLAWRYLRWRWAMLALATLFMVLIVVVMQGLQLVPASQRFGPVFHPVTHLLPPAFPVLLVIPAAALTWVLCRARDVRRFRVHLAAGAVFVVTMLAANWALSAFLETPWAANRFFAGNHPPAAFIPAHLPVRTVALDAVSGAWAALSVVLAAVSSRLGCALGGWAQGVVR